MSIPIFERTDKKNGLVYRGYVFTYTEGGQRKQKRCRTPRRPCSARTRGLGFSAPDPRISRTEGMVMIVTYAGLVSWLVARA
jgi:hypothetical protein